MIFLDPKTDTAFKKLFGDIEHKGVVISFLNSVLDRQKGEQIVDVVFNDPYNLPDSLELKKSIVDIKVTDEKGKHYLIEMQVVDQEDFAQRCQYYSAVALARQIPKRGKYNTLMPVIFIGVLNFNLFTTKNYVSHHLIMDQEIGQQSLRMQEFHFIELLKFNLNLDELKNTLEKWIYLLKYANTLESVPKALQKNEEIQEAFHILNKLNWTNRELDAYDAERDAIWSRQSQIDTAEKKAKEKGLKEGLKEGIKAGIQEGIKEGIKEGEEKRTTEIARNALAKGKLTLQEISELTGIAIETLKKLKD